VEPRSVAFDRAAEYYDETRGLSREGVRRQTELLAAELEGRGRVLEIGVGTGQVALPLHEVGIDVVGLDLARPMMAKLVEKAGGRSPFPLVQADATRLPFPDGTFGAAYLRWVLHLIPAWRTALEETTRVLGSGGTILVSLGAVGPKDTAQSEIQARFAELAGVSLAPSGLMWAGWNELDAAIGELGATPRELPAFAEVAPDGLEVFIDGIANSAYSWTWKVQDPELLGRVAGEVRTWAEERYGPLDRFPRREYEVIWRAYDLP
jgi:SAM-dependent methyltransferase